MPLPFNKTLDLKLLALVKDNQVLYNNQDPKYMDFDSREVVWQRIADRLGRPAAICKARWINIRDMMRRKIRYRIRNPDHRGYRYKYEDQMAFMLPFFKEFTPSQEYPEFLDEPMDFQGFQTEEKVPKKREYEELNPNDPIDVFLLSIGSTLRKFSPYYLNQSKSKIFQVVQEFELQQIMDRSGPSNR